MDIIDPVRDKESRERAIRVWTTVKQQNKAGKQPLPSAIEAAIIRLIQAGCEILILTRHHGEISTEWAWIGENVCCDIMEALHGYTIHTPTSGNEPLVH